MKAIIFFFFLFFAPLYCKKDKILYHKTIGIIESYKDIDTVNLKPGCIKRLTKNLLTPIHKRDLILSNTVQKHLLSKTNTGKLIISFLVPLSMKKEILELLSSKKLYLSIPYGKKDNIITSNIEVDRYSEAPKGLFAMRSYLETDILTPSTVLFINLLKDET